MKDSFKAVKITDNVYWVGAIDWGLRDFHGYSTSRGSTYNAFLILAEKVTLIDVVKAPFKEELLARIASVIDPEKIDYIVSNHAEMDHSGCLPEIIDRVKPEKVFASPMGVKALKAHFAKHPGIDAVQAVKTGDELSLGNLTLSFIETRLIHWPDSMFSYLKEEQLLFSQDGFGMHLASGHRFTDEEPQDILYYEAAKYFANILLLYADKIAKTLQSVKEMNLPIKIIAPDHGPVWRENPGQVIEWYEKWCEQKPKKKVVITFDTMWKSTETMARSIAEGVFSKGVDAVLLPLSGNHRSDVVTEILEAGALVVGSPTMNNNMLPSVADILCYMKGLKPKNLIGFSFGSYGWSGESVRHIDEVLLEMGVEMTGPGVSHKYVPDEQILQECFRRGVDLAEKLNSAGC